MKILDFFDRAYVINLPERSDRRYAVALELEKAGMPFTPGKLEIFQAIRPDNAGEFPNIGARGCFLSHLSVLKMAQKQGLSNVLILEDDVLIKKQFVRDQSLLMQQLAQANWGFAYFGHPLFTPVGKRANFAAFSEPIVTTHFYGINAHILDRLIEFLDEMDQRPSGHPDGGPMHLDGAYNLFREKYPDVEGLRVLPSLVDQRSSRSDVHPNAWYEKLPVAKQVLDLARSGKDVLRAW